MDGTVFGIKPDLSEQVLHIALELLSVLFDFDIFVMNQLLQVLIVVVHQNQQHLDEIRPHELKFTLLVLIVLV